MGLRIDFSTPMVRQPDLMLEAIERDPRVLTSAFRIDSTGEITGGGFGVGGVGRAGMGNVIALAISATRTVTLVQTADEALGQIDTRLLAIRELLLQAIEAAAGQDTLALRALQREIDEQLREINLIIETARFGGRPLLDGTFRSNPFAIDEDNAARLAIPLLAPNTLGRGVENVNGFRSLADIDVIPNRGTEEALRVVDTAIDDVGRVRADLNAVETESLEATSRNMELLARNSLGADFTRDISGSGLSEIDLRTRAITRSIAGDQTGIALDLVA